MKRIIKFCLVVYWVGIGMVHSIAQAQPPRQFDHAFDLGAIATQDQSYYH